MKKSFQFYIAIVIILILLVVGGIIYVVRDNGHDGETADGSSGSEVANMTETSTEKKEESTEQKKELKWIVEPKYDFTDVQPLSDYIYTGYYNNNALGYIGENAGLLSNATGEFVVPVSENAKVTVNYVSGNNYATFSPIGTNIGDISFMKGVYSGISYFYALDKQVVCRSSEGGIRVGNSGIPNYPAILRNYRDVSNSRAAEKVGTYTLISAQEKRVLDEEFQAARSSFQGYMLGDCYLVKKNDKWGYLDLSGNKITEFVYEDAYIMQNGIAAVKKEGKAGFIDKAGNPLCEFVFEETRTVNSNVAWVKYNGKWQSKYTGGVSSSGGVQSGGSSVSAATTGGNGSETLNRYASERTGYCFGDLVRIRRGPGTDYDVITQISYINITLIGDNGSAADLWYYVRIPDGTEGWITGQYVSEGSGAPNASSGVMSKEEAEKAVMNYFKTEMPGQITYISYFEWNGKHTWSLYKPWHDGPRITGRCEMNKDSTILTVQIDYLSEYTVDINPYRQ